MLKKCKLTLTLLQMDPKKNLFMQDINDEMEGVIVLLPPKKAQVGAF